MRPNLDYGKLADHIVGRVRKGAASRRASAAAQMRAETAEFRKKFDGFGLVPKGCSIRVNKAPDGSGYGIHIVCKGNEHLLTFSDTTDVENILSENPSLSAIPKSVLMENSAWATLAYSRAQAKTLIEDALAGFGFEEGKGKIAAVTTITIETGPGGDGHHKVHLPQTVPAPCEDAEVLEEMVVEELDKKAARVEYPYYCEGCQRESQDPFFCDTCGVSVDRPYAESNKGGSEKKKTASPEGDDVKRLLKYVRDLSDKDDAQVGEFIERVKETKAAKKYGGVDFDTLYDDWLEGDGGPKRGRGAKAYDYCYKRWPKYNEMCSDTDEAADYLRSDFIEWLETNRTEAWNKISEKDLEDLEEEIYEACYAGLT